MHNFKLNEIAYDIQHKNFVEILDCPIEYSTLPDAKYFIVRYETKKNEKGVIYSLLPEKLVKLDPDTPENRLAIQIKHG
jgi:hypothetical protein